MITQETIDKFVLGLEKISQTLGRLDVLRLHLKNDEMALIVLNAIIDDLSAFQGIDYKKLLIEAKENQEQKIFRTISSNIEPIKEKEETEAEAEEEIMQKETSEKKSSKKPKENE